MADFLTVGALLTYGGASAAVAALTEVFKPLVRKLPFALSMRTVSYFTALAVLSAAAFFSGCRDWADYALCAVNAALVSLSSNGGYDLVSKLTEEADTEDNDDNNT